MQDSLHVSSGRISIRDRTVPALEKKRNSRNASYEIIISQEKALIELLLCTDRKGERFFPLEKYNSLNIFMRDRIASVEELTICDAVCKEENCTNWISKNGICVQLGIALRTTMICLEVARQFAETQQWIRK